MRRQLASRGGADTYLFDNSMTSPSIPAGAKIRVVGDVHGDVTGFGYALATDRFVVQLGDLVDHGRDSASTLRDDVRSGGAWTRAFPAG